jgi:hypothetical protein
MGSGSQALSQGSVARSASQKAPPNQGQTKPRMTKAEKAIVKAINEIVFKTPEERDGKKFLDRVAFQKLPDQTQKIWLDLVMNKTY